MTFDEFKILVKAMKSAYTSPNFIPDEYSIKMWYKFLEDLPYDLATMSVQQYIARNKFQPTIADIRENAVAIVTKDIDWSESWQQVCRLISLYGLPNEQKAYAEMDEATEKAVKRIGWKNLCMSQNASVDRSNYRIIFEAVVKERKDHLSLPQAISDKLKLIGE